MHELKKTLLGLPGNGSNGMAGRMRDEKDEGKLRHHHLLTQRYLKHVSDMIDDEAALLAKVSEEGEWSSEDVESDQK
jgi:hypothetical protein